MTVSYTFLAWPLAGVAERPCAAGADFPVLWRNFPLLL